MGFRQIFKISRKTFINPTGWIDFDFLKYHHRVIWDICKPLFTTPTPPPDESFEQAMQRLRISEDDVLRGATVYRYYALAFLCVGFLIFFYSFYLLFRYFSIAGWIIGLAVAALGFSQAFKYDFWSFQMRKRKLGVTFAEWKNDILGDKGTSK